MTQPRPFRKPPDVEEALSSMLWTPYDNNVSDSDSSPDDDDDSSNGNGPSPGGNPFTILGRYSHSNAQNNHLPSSSWFQYGGGQPNVSSTCSSSAGHHPATLMKRSLSERNYRSSSSNSADGKTSNRISYPYYGMHHSSPMATDLGTPDGYWDSNNIYPNDYPPGPGPAMASTRQATLMATTIFPLPLDSYWKQNRSIASQPLPPLPQPALVPALPFNLLLGADSLFPTNANSTLLLPPPSSIGSASGTFCEEDLVNSNMMLLAGVDDTFADYQVYPTPPPPAPVGIGASSYIMQQQQPPRVWSQLLPNVSSSASAPSFLTAPMAASSSMASGYIQPPSDDNNNSLSKISAILKPVMRSASNLSHNGNVGDLHFSKHQQHRCPQRPNSEPEEERRLCSSSSIENATGSSSTNTMQWMHRYSRRRLQSTDELNADATATLSAAATDEHSKQTEQQNTNPFNDLQQHYPQTGGFDGDVDEYQQHALVNGTALNGLDRVASFSSVRIVNGEATTACGSFVDASERRFFASTDQRRNQQQQQQRSTDIERNSVFGDQNNNNNYSSGSTYNNRRYRALDSLKGFGRSVRDRFANIMRLNVPAAPEGSRTSVYIPSSEGTIASVDLQGNNSGHEAGSRPTLTIQVNRVDTNNQQQNDVVNNASSGVSIVNCYRETPVSATTSKENATSDSNDGESGLECQFNPSDVNSANPNANKIPVNISASAEQMVHVSNDTIVASGDYLAHDQNQNPTIKRSHSVHNSSSDQQTILPYPQTDIDQIEQNLSRTYTSTEAQTDSLPPITSAPVPLRETHPYPTQPILATPTHPTLLLTPPLTEFNTREHRRRERRERRQARNRMQHVHPMDQQPLRPAPLEIIPDILHSHLPPPYTTLPMGATAVLAGPPPPLPIAAVPLGHHHRGGPLGVAAAAAVPGVVEDCRYTFPIPIIRSSPSERSRKGCCGHWFAGPPLRALIAVVALGGVACALGGAALGATGLAGSPTSHLTAALLMIGVGVILVTVSGAAWRMTAPGAPPCLGLGSTVDLARCSRRPCGRGGSTPHGLLYPEFQHRPPPPSYQASMQEYRLRLLLLDRDRQSGRIRSTASPPPTYRSNVGSLLRIPLTSRQSNSASSANGSVNGAHPPGSNNSTGLFGGLSGIISGAIGGGNGSSTASTPQHPRPPTAVGSEAPSNGVGAPAVPPPTYRTIDRRDSATSFGDTANSQLEDQLIIKIDDTKSAPLVGSGLNSTPQISTTTTTTAVVHHKQRNSITAETIENDYNSGSNNSTSNSYAIGNSSANGGNSIKVDDGQLSRKSSKNGKDLVTIVTISGSLERSKQTVNGDGTTSAGRGDPSMDPPNGHL
ncbi:uncharacterized protein LOC129751445 [Uranotaenia lowii]|uniref:uncharacterized protein LOC129751445 n=1 Tax=Uranotaenia lowii TaxID=190385 RepID=UPI0024796BA0|nr:uncharacterized protein LOC129751445 [Uranotaenia lowii]XP_055602940.1 uncharacterized protein LOC129751445 [Uranotaenia lowii]XP_055602941.1 uncharacterized protein LOC129751445 [Uranotaenia lowii]